MKKDSFGTTILYSDVDPAVWKGWDEHFMVGDRLRPVQRDFLESNPSIAEKLERPRAVP